MDTRSLNRGTALPWVLSLVAGGTMLAPPAALARLDPPPSTPSPTTPTLTTPTPAPQPAADPSVAQAEKLLTAGDVLFQEGLFDRALPKYQEAQRLDPENLVVRLRLASVHAKLKNRAAGLEALEALLKARPELKNEPELAALRAELEQLPGPPAGNVPAASSPSNGASADAAWVEDQRFAAANALAANAALKLVMEAAKADATKEAKADLAKRAREKLSEALADPEQSNIEVWYAAGWIADIQDDLALAAQAFEGIARCKPDYHTDERLLSLMTRLDEQPLFQKAVLLVADQRKLKLKLMSIASTREGRRGIMYGLTPFDTEPGNDKRVLAGR